MLRRAELGVRRFPINGNAQICKAAVEKMSEGFAVQLTSGEDVAIRIFPDIHIVGGNIRSALPLATEGTQEPEACQGAQPDGDRTDRREPMEQRER